MNRWLWVISLILISNTALADARTELQKRLKLVESFNAEFSQMVVAADGSKVQEAKGELWIRRPNLFRWHTKSPDESLLISDGETLWFYNPFVEQVTANWLDSATGNTPFMLIARNKNSDWVRYQIKQDGDSFELVPKENDGNLKRFELTLNNKGVISAFTTVEQDGQRSTYTLSQQRQGAINNDKFRFIQPKGVTLDDQRQY